MLTIEQNALVEARYPGRIEGLVKGEAIHRCPICAELGECFTADNFHSCKWCGSTWRTTAN